MNKIKNYINGKFSANSTEYLNVIDPSKGEVINQVVLSNNKESLSDLLLYLKSNQDELRIKSFLASNKYKNSFSASVILEKWEKIINY